ncbi:hypothetical protein [Chondromyces crocatus]|uniref:Uncharacterized protein n=1 Tax=Chondromyces crocatus TaxID=52 RepID=A0A0K1ERM6_CHOCO|nr:hypothetical protein [Chondromyces crocatus]AKT43474.1 uncharacterized protein CMC5_077060 [Chondromyces crocatus]
MGWREEAIANDWFLNCIALIKRSPGMWVPTKSARELDLFFLGYMKARNDLGLPEYGGRECGLLEAFQTWLCAKLNLDPRVGWVHCVEQLDRRPENIGTFVSLFEEFLGTLGKTLPEADPEQWVGMKPPRSGNAEDADVEERPSMTERFDP